MNRYLWQAHYHDGSVIVQNSINPLTNKEMSSDHLPDQHKIKALVLQPQHPSIPKVVLHINEGETFKRFWTHYLDAGDSSKTTCWVLQLTHLIREGTPIDFYTFVRPDGSIIVSTDPEGLELVI